MSSLPPEPPPKRKRRTWVWVLLTIIGLFVVCCCAGTVWANTDSGQNWIGTKATELSDYMTEEAGP